MAKRKPDAADFARNGATNVGELLLPSPDPTLITDADVPTGTDMEVQERRTLAVIIDDLVAYQDTREMADTDADRAEIDHQIARRQAELLCKVDRYAAVMRRLEMEAGWEKSEADRHAKRRKRYEAAYEFLERYAVRTMQAAGTRKLEGHGAALKMKQGPGALVVTAECDVPAEFKSVTITMLLAEWELIIEKLPDYPLDTMDAKVTVLKDRAKRAIKAGEEVPGADITFDDFLVVE